MSFLFRTILSIHRLKYLLALPPYNYNLSMKEPRRMNAHRSNDELASINNRAIWVFRREFQSRTQQEIYCVFEWEKKKNGWKKNGLVSAIVCDGWTNFSENSEIETFARRLLCSNWAENRRWTRILIFHFGGMLRIMRVLGHDLHGFEVSLRVFGKKWR